ncbi:aminotransferase-like domain-containing protein [Granulicella paludicola]|uniref:aminotransferase-like domain-containing protein n=1 Tax=Granulicella paludicola TaxID=474951 RepID=UPI0021E0EFA3|nr:PLP-dependent aminotransferase family protein [Granulicella paludicola]
MTASRASSLANALAERIHSGQLAPGTLLPTHRKFAATHKIALATASRVYAELKVTGLIVGETGRGSFVRERPLQREWDSGDEARLNRQAADLSFNHPNVEGQAELMRSTLRSMASSGDIASFMHQQPSGGRRHERDIVCRYLAARNIVVENEQVLLVSGAQHGLDIAVRAKLHAGDRVAVDALTYPGFKMIAASHGIELIPVAACDSGPDLDVLERTCRDRKLRAIYSMPTVQNPLGWVLDHDQRHSLVNIARRHDCLLLEDATYSFLAHRAPPALVTMAPERTIYVSSLSKNVATGLRFGFMVVPKPFISAIKAQVRANFWSMPSLITSMATRWIADGTVDRLERRGRREAKVRQALARQAFCGLDLIANPISLFAWLKLPPELRMDRVTAALAERNIAVSTAQAYATTKHVPHALRVGLSSLSTDALKEALQRVREVIDEYPI